MDENPTIKRKQRKARTGMGVCKRCKRTFTWDNHSGVSPEYCSHSCRYPNVKVKKTCLACKREYHVIPYRAKKSKYCSLKCKIAYQKGPRNPVWKGGLSAYYSNDISWKKARTEALKRDNYRCAICGLSNAVDVHHIIPYRLSKSHELVNLISLCKDCHVRFERDTAEVLAGSGFGGHPLVTQLMCKAWLLHLKKNLDYSRKDDPLFNLRLCEQLGIPAWKGVIIRLTDKFSRVMNLASGKELQVKEETIEDTLVDITNYALLAVVLLREDLAKRKLERNKDE